MTANSDSPASPNFQLGYRPALDGLRGVAILAVMALHTFPPLARGGYIGVDIFFVLSGFLITVLLLEEWDQRGAIRLGTFYFRRALRLLPALLGLLAGCWLYARVFHSRSWADGLLHDTPAALFYVFNWWMIGWPEARATWMLDHAWSLAVEEQFYLLWPPALLGLLQWGVRRSRLALLLLAGIAAAVGWRLVLWQGPGAIVRLYHGTDTRADALLIGCLLGVLTVSGWLPRGRWLRVLVPIALGVLLWHLGWTTHLGDAWVYRGGLTLVASASAVVLVALLHDEAPVLGRMLASAPLVWVGRLSYGLYLWHWPVFCELHCRLRTAPPWMKLLLQFGSAFALAALSYYVLERPVLRWKDRLGKQRARSASEGCPSLALRASG
jgi:peptidoglycan/LPS O-acetylase OafA/YrhL